MTNVAFREHVFSQHFVLTIRQRACELLARLCLGEDSLAPLLWSREMQQLLERGLVERRAPAGGDNGAWYPTKAGLLVYELMVEAGEHKALDETRRRAIAAEDEAHRLYWEELERDAMRRITLKKSSQGSAV